MIRLLLDTHVLLGLVDRDLVPLPEAVVALLAAPGHRTFVSVASLWEAAIKHRLGKLPLPCPLDEWPVVLESAGVIPLPVTIGHVTADLDPWPDTKDPFDRLLLAAASVEGMKLVTFDQKLADHPLAWRPA